MKKIFPLLHIMLLLFTTGSLAQGSFSATLQPAVIGKDETTELKLLVENASQAELSAIPSFKDFYVISGPNQESGMESINGNVRRYVGYSYILKPKSTGNFTIGPASAKVDGKTLRSNPLSLKVTNTATGNAAPNNNPFAGLSPFDEPAPASTYNDFILKKGERAEDKIDRNIFIRVQADKTSCYVGEPLVVTYKLYTRLKSESNIIKSPAFNGFSVVDLVPPNGENYTVEKLDGRMYNVYLLRKAQLYPLQAGADTLESASVENKINFVKAEYLNSRNTDDFLNGFLSSLPPEAVQTEKVMLQSKPVAIMVKPLPGGDSLASFHGAVGDFSIQAIVDKTDFTTSDAGKLRVTITGAGNLTLLNPPEIKWPAGIEAFEPEAKENVNRLSVPVTGTKMYTYSFTIESSGNYTLPPVVFSYFDLASKRFKTIETEPIQLTITKGTGVKAPLVKTDDRSALDKFYNTIFTNRWMIIVPVAMLILIGLFFWLRADEKKQEKISAGDRQKDNAEEETRSGNIPKESLVKHPFEQSEKFLILQDSRLFYQTLNRELQALLTSKLNMAEGVGKKSIAEALDKSGIGFGKTIVINQLMDDIEMQLYTPFADENLQAFYERALEVSTSLKTQ